ncbi:MAG TPA: aldo/keto reductase [Solirubrobacteraceae bacterium]|jgi:aryl-alcohol dehydrogenase-like predicted oxidoreductase|nr:aldo/keto reductase [Solirubrobacteraceae bacterium]
METRSIGSLTVSVVGIGCNNFGSKVVGKLDQQRTNEVVAAALDAGVTFFDTADAYGGGASETFLGTALGSRRDEIVLASKFGMRLADDRQGAKPEYVKRAIEASLERLGTDRIDLYMLHKPDPETPIAETLGALGELKAAGKVREIGCSNFSAEQLEEARSSGLPSFVAVQNELSLLNRAAEAEVLPYCAEHGIGFVPYYPLFNGLLTGKYKRGAEPPSNGRITSFADDRKEAIFSEENFDRIERLEAFAGERGHKLLELAFAWLLAKAPVASVIAGSTSPEQIKANAAAASWTLTEDEAAEVDALVA